MSKKFFIATSIFFKNLYIEIAHFLKLNQVSEVNLSDYSRNLFLKLLKLIMKILTLYSILYILISFINFPTTISNNEVLQGKFLESGGNLLLYYLYSTPINIILLLIVVILSIAYLILIGSLLIIIFGEKNKSFEYSSALFLHSTLYSVAALFPILIINTIINLLNSTSFFVIAMQFFLIILIFFLSCLFSLRLFLKIGPSLFAVNKSRIVIIWSLSNFSLFYLIFKIFNK